ncbi:hypothetical protein [Pelagibacterium mangrovi]|uniref:hypothetical protein n=1 Tax=Pelagibacterium mangrovi TaxID=3119828 RepID=UPI002FCA22D4
MTEAGHRREAYEAIHALHIRRQSAHILGILMALVGVPIWIIGRAWYFVSLSPGGDITRDGKFTISDVAKGFEFSFIEPSVQVLKAMNSATPRILAFFEIGPYSTPGWALLLISTVAWAIVWWLAAEVVSFSLRGCWIAWQTIRDIRTGKERLMKGDVVVLGVVAFLLVFVWVVPYFAR